MSEDKYRAFPIVAIGASAGGLYALEQFFDNMPPDSGMAFVVIQHLSPDFKSLMDDILSRRTTMRIKRVEDGMALEPDTIYLIPPKCQMTLSQGLLHLRDKLPQPYFELPIDIFLQSLAEDAGDRAVAVILSGTGSDGSRGLHAIHRKGGLTIAQSPESAQFDGMPRSALATGIVDFELSPDRIPELLVEYCKNPESVLARRPFTDSAEAENENQDDFSEIFNILRRSYGLDFSKYKVSTVGRRIARRMESRHTTSIDDYTVLLASDEIEQDLLYHDLLIGVTEFFRDPESFRIIEDQIAPALLAACNPDEELRIWSAGCATGEEAYSLAIIFKEKSEEMGLKNRITVFATDVHRTSLEFASTGIYDQQRLSNLSKERIERHFRPENPELYRVSPDLRKMVVFAPHNITNDPPFTRLDLICCRNMLIYLLPEEQERAISLFHYGLKLDGFLFLGSSEGLGIFSPEFETISSHSKLFKKRREMRIAMDFGSSRNLRTSKSIQLVKPANNRTLTVNRQIMHDYDHILKNNLPPGVLVDEERKVLHYFGDVAPFLKPKEGRVVDNETLLMVEDSLHIAVSTALQRASKERERIHTKNIRLNTRDEEMLLDMIVDPIYDDKSRSHHYHIYFDRLRPVELPPAQTDNAKEFDVDGQYRQYIQDLEFELQSTQEALQATIEELQTSNEELQATNEELLASNEELQSTNEELHSINEELYTVNAEFERKNSELRQLNLDHDGLLQSLETGIIFLDCDLRIRKFNPAVQTIFRLMPHDLGRPIDHISYVLSDQTELMTDMRSVLEGSPLIDREKQLADGRWLLYRAMPFSIDRNRIDGVILSFTDVTRLKEAELIAATTSEQLEVKVKERTAQLQEEIQQRIWAMEQMQKAKEEAELANRAKSQFLATMSHEIRTPMNGVLGFLQLLELSQLTPEQQEYLRLMSYSAESLLQLLGNILDISKIESGEVAIDITCFRVDELLESVVQLAAPLAKDKKLAFNLHENQNLPHSVEGDPLKIRQILINLLTNAIKFTEHGSVTLSVETREIKEDRAWVAFTVTDTGCGIPADKIDDIFKPFVQADGSITRKYGGTGLGLTICERLSLLMEGTIEVRSTEGEGSSFIVVIPLDSCDNEVGKRNPKPLLPAPWEGRSLNLLVAEDNSMSRHLVCKLMESVGHHSTGVENGVEALDQWKNGSFDLILMDIDMPVMDGVMTTKLIREAEQHGKTHIPIVALTVHALPQERDNAISAGMDGFVTKPVVLKELLVAIKDAVEKADGLSA